METASMVKTNDIIKHTPDTPMSEGAQWPTKKQTGWNPCFPSISGILPVAATCDYNNHQNDFLKKIIEGYLKILFSILKKMGKMRKILDNAISGFLNKHTDTLYIV